MGVGEAWGRTNARRAPHSRSPSPPNHAGRLHASRLSFAGFDFLPPSLLR
jgi:hypothetical protein